MDDTTTTTTVTTTTTTAATTTTSSSESSASALTLGGDGSSTFATDDSSQETIKIQKHTSLHTTRFEALSHQRDTEDQKVVEVEKALSEPSRSPSRSLSKKHSELKKGESESVVNLHEESEGLYSLRGVVGYNSPETYDYPENEGDDIIWPDEKSYSEELITEYFLEAYYDAELMSLQTREDLILSYKNLVTERNRLLSINQKLQAKAMDFLQKKKVATTKTKEPSARMQVDYEEKFSRYLFVWESLMATYTKDENQLSTKFKTLKETYENKLEEIEKENEAFCRYKRSQIKGAVHSQTGEKLTEEKADYLLQKERQRQDELKSLRMINFNMKYRIKKKELSVHSKEELAGGHHMYDFEQLKIENQAYNEKIEERNEELSKLRRKIMNTLQVMGHIKEKIFYMVNENEVTKKVLAELDAEANKKREQLSKIKQIKDTLREDRGKLQQKSGLLGKSLMLRDMRLKQENAIQLKNELNFLKLNHQGYTVGIQRLNAQFKLANLSDYK